MWVSCEVHRSASENEPRPQLTVYLASVDLHRLKNSQSEQNHEMRNPPFPQIQIPQYHSSHLSIHSKMRVTRIKCPISQLRGDTRAGETRRTRRRKKQGESEKKVRNTEQ